MNATVSAATLAELESSPEKLIELSTEQIYSLPRDVQARLQLAGLRKRYAELNTRIPILGRVAADIGTIFINRQDFTDVARVNTRIDQAIAQGMSVVIFPEATTTEGSGLLPFHASLLESAARSGRPVWYGALHYSTPIGSRPASESVAWGEDIGMREHMQRLLALPSFTARMRYGREPIGGSNRKQLAQALRTAVIALFEPVGQ